MAAILRPARVEDAAGVVRVHGDTWRAAYRGIVPDPVLAGWGREPDAVERRRRWLGDPEKVSFVAEEAGEVVGFVNGGRNRDESPRFDAELYALYVLPGRQGGGLGRRLVARCASALAERGFRAMVLWVLRDNARGRAFYARLGGTPAGEREIVLGGAALVEVACGWEDIGVVVRSIGGRDGSRPPP